MKFDDIISVLGEFGPYQKRVYFLVCLVCIPACHLLLSTIFTMAIPAHRCAIPDLENDTYESQGQWHDDLVRLTIPWDSDDQKFSDCRISVRQNGTVTNETKGCDRYVYSKDPFSMTVVSEFDMVCDNLDRRTYANMLLMLGNVFGSFVVGPLSDLIGRKPVLVGSIACYAATSLGIAFAPNYITLILLRFMSTFCSQGLFLCSLVMGMEWVGPSKRRYSGTVVEIFWCVGMFILIGVAYGIRDWRTLKIATAAPVVLMLSFWWLMPESPRWLINKGRLKEARQILQKAARVNGVTLSDDILTLCVTEDNEPQGKIWQMFTTPILLVRSLTVFFNSFVASMVYYGLSLNVGALSGSIYVNATYSTVAEVASYVFCLLFLDIIGRKKLQCFSMALGGLSCMATMFPVIFHGPDWITVTLSMVGKFGASAAFATIFVYANEIFPTCMRNSGLAASALWSRIGGVVAPYIGDLGQTVKGPLSVSLPLIVFGGLCLAGGLSALWLPETHNRKLPDTVEDAKNFVRSGKQQNTIALEILADDK